MMTQATAPMQPTVDVRRHDDRFRTRLGWLDSRHSFSFSRHYDPGNTHHGLLLVNNDDIVTPGRGFETHPHQDMEIVTWVLQGSLVHQDSTGHSGLIYPGLAQRLRAAADFAPEPRERFCLYAYGPPSRRITTSSAGHGGPSRRALSSSRAARCPFGNWSPGSQRHAATIARTRIRHSRSSSWSASG
jgi:hypothetical protein